MVTRSAGRKRVRTTRRTTGMRRGVRQGTKPGRGGEGERARRRGGETGGERARIGRHGANGEGGRGTRAERGGADGDEEQSVPSSPLRYGLVRPSPPSANAPAAARAFSTPWPTYAGWDDAHVAMGAYSSKVGYMSGIRCTVYSGRACLCVIRSDLEIRIQNHCRLKTVYLRCSHNVRPQF
ncbi:hypothetical protein DFH08DRAFT_887694 [Mycena albidolilacea]|uniref:Uncharacterized protein n=1 Tax=Mycena albidolilacea TaxID=1033008 RepID=A0AAD7EGN3_9AGAR|nr:hypothetical protein DFH08DRAFT_887694 [Mycena albidolilacea]